ncbi:hypothetical protein PFISCL1PPCAC_14330, partial [Pristionchus fissidentatus]
YLPTELLGLLTELGREVGNTDIVVGRTGGDSLHARVLIENLFESGIADEIEGVEGLHEVVCLRGSRTVLVEKIVE